MTIARYLSKFANLLNSDGKVVNAGIANNTLQSDKFASGTLGNFRNRIINGDMKIAQRGTSFSAVGGYTLDRFTHYNGTTAAFTYTQSTNVPANSGFSNSLRATVTTADTSIISSDESVLIQYIEGYHISDLVGVPITLSFWVRSSKTGIHCVSFRNGNLDKSYVSKYTIIAANTWEKQVITIPLGITTSGAWNFNNLTGLCVSWAMVAGSGVQTATPNSWVDGNKVATSNQVNCLDTVGNIFSITGVQLEKGSVASEFEFRPYPVELALCQRYYEIAPGMSFRMCGTTSGTIGVFHPFKVQKRVTPSVSLSGTVYSVNSSALSVNITSTYGWGSMWTSGDSTIHSVVGFQWEASAEL